MNRNIYVRIFRKNNKKRNLVTFNAKLSFYTGSDNDIIFQIFPNTIDWELGNTVKKLGFESYEDCLIKSSDYFIKTKKLHKDENWDKYVSVFGSYVDFSVNKHRKKILNFKGGLEK